MGQRLVVSVQSGGKDIARIYYHWSAYTRSALNEAREIIECIRASNFKTVPQLQLALIHMCEKNGGGIDGGLNGPEGKIIQERFPDEEFSNKFLDRSYGLIAITESGMDYLMGWAEGCMTIDVDTHMITNHVFYSYDFEEWKEQYGTDYANTQEEFEHMTIDDLVELHHNIEDISFFELDTLIRELDACVANGIYVFRRGNIVYDLIE